MTEQVKKAVDFDELKKFVANHGEDYSALLKRFVNGDETLTLEELKTVYYGSPFAGFKMDKEVIALADYHLRFKDYKMAYYLYIDALGKNPVSPMLLKKAYNCAYLGAFSKAESQKLMAKRNMMSRAIESTGDGASVETAMQVVATEDEYQFLYNTVHVKDVMSQSVAATKGDVVVDDMTVAVLGEKEPRHYFFECYGETEADMQDFFNRKKGF